MSEAGAVLLVSCYELGHQPLGIAWAMSFLRQAGMSPEAMDVSVDGFDENKVLSAGFVGISVPMHTALRLGFRVAKRVRRVNPRAHICFFGLYASLNAEFLLGSVADSVIGGEYEASLVSLVNSLNGGIHDPVEGVFSASRAQAPVLKRLAFMLPDRSRLPGLKRYAQLEYRGQRVLAGQVEASRGCKHLCLHCPIPPVYKGRFFTVPQDVVLEDIGHLVDSGARHITFGDPDFLNGPGHSVALVRRMRREFPGITLDFTAKIEHILKHRGLFPELARSGCLFVISAVESLSDEVLRKLRKGHTHADVLEALRLLRDLGIALRPSWVAFTPWTTLPDYIEMLDFVAGEELAHHVDPVQFSIRLLVPPGSELIARGVIQPFLGELDQDNFYHPWRHPDPRMDGLHAKVSRLVEQACRRDEDPGVTFERIRTAAYEAAGLETPTGGEAPGRSGRASVPRLTEAWFCCAEPTDRQFKAIEV